MNVSSYQLLLLDDLSETQPWQHRECNGEQKRSLDIMLRKGLVSKISYADGDHWTITDAGSHELELHHDNAK